MTLASTDRDDAELLRAARRGDEQAARLLLDRHLPSVVAICRSRLRDPADVDDAVQETLERTLRRLHQLRDPAALGSWARAVAARVCVDMHRRATREQAHGRAATRTVGWADEPDVVVLVDEEAREVHDRLETLDERDRLALWWRDALGMPVHEIAAELSLTNGATRAVLTRARRRFRESYLSVGAGVCAVAGTIRERAHRLGVRGGSPTPWELAGQVVAASAAVLLLGAPSAPAPDAPQDPAPTPAAATSVPDPADDDIPVASTTPTPTASTSTPTAPAAPTPAHTPEVDVDAEAPRGALTVTRRAPAEDPVADVREPESGIGAEVYAGELHEVTDELVQGTAEVLGDASTAVPGIR